MPKGCVMVESITFEDLEQAERIDYQKPFWAMDLSNDDVVITWLKAEYNRIKNDNSDRYEKAKNNYLRYKGFQYFNTVYQPRDVLESGKKYSPQMVIPLISDAVDEKVARLMELKPFVEPIPRHDETSDKKDTRMAKSFLSYVDYTQKLDQKFTKVLKSSKIGGESFLWIRWNPDLGENMPEAKMANKFVPMGDLEIVHKTLFNIKYPKLPSWEMTPYVYIEEFVPTEALKRDYPEHADKITQDTDCKMFDYSTMSEIELKGYTRKVYFYYKNDKYLPQGYEAIYANSVLLKKGDNPYAHGGFPLERIVDIENDEENSGQSFIDKVKSIAAQGNNVMNAMIKMLMLAGYAKWFVEEGSVDEDHLNNDINIVKVKRGADKPILAQSNPVGEAHFKIFDLFENLFYKMSKSNSVIRGEPPPGVTAGVALQYVSESESRRLSSDVQTLNQFVINVYDKALQTAGQFYGKDEKRKMMILGKDNKWETIGLDVSSIAKPYAIVLKSVSGLSDSKAVRIQQTLDMEDRFPGMVPREQVAEITGFAQGGEKFLDIAGRAARAAEDENEYMQETGQQIEPVEWEDLITHWKIHVQAVQPLDFKMKAPQEVQKTMYNHILATEMMMMDHARKNPTFNQLLLALPGFPMLMEPETPPAPIVVDPVSGQEIPSDLAVAVNPNEIQPETPPQVPVDPVTGAQGGVDIQNMKQPELPI